jgi:DNA-binding transcriptional regulator GbsR (MarR family)
MKETTYFHYRFSKEIKIDMDIMEKSIKNKRQKLPKEQLEEEFKEMVLDLGYSRTIDTKIFKLIKLY